MAASPSETTEHQFVVKVPVVRRAIARIRERETHPFFPAYLHLREVAGNQRRLTGLKPRWGQMGLYLQVPDHPKDKPYFQPFGTGWLNRNLAGSWAGSSLRAGQPPFNVVEYDGAAKTFTLKDRHWELARATFLNDEPADPIAIAAFLYRDFAFVTSGEPPGPADLITVFRDDFRYRIPEDDEEFNYLFVGDAEDPEWGDSFEPWESPPA